MAKKLIVLLFVCMIFTSCSRPVSQEKQIVETVLQHVFDLSESESLESALEQEQSQVIPSGTLGIIEGASPDFDYQLSQLYRPYFTEKGYSDFVNNRYPFKYALMNKSSNCTLKLAKINIKQDEKNSEYFTFTCDIQITNDKNETRTIEEKGTALFGNENNNKAISWFWLSDNNDKTISSFWLS